MVEIITENDELAIEKAFESINAGFVIAIPTETVYGLACDAYQETAVEQIYNIKGRDPSKPLSILVENIEYIRDIIDVTPDIEDLVRKYTPGALTIVANVKNESRLAKNINNSSKTIGFRMPDHPFCLKLLARLKRPLVATSVNLSGEDAITNALEIVKNFTNRIPLVIDGGESKAGIPSTVVDMTGNNLKILRQGLLKIN